jgi:hypothetical protein
MAILTLTGSNWDDELVPTSLKLPAPIAGPGALANWRAGRVRGLARSPQAQALRACADAWRTGLSQPDRDFWKLRASERTRPLRASGTQFTSGWTFYMACNLNRILAGLAPLLSLPEWIPFELDSLVYHGVNRATNSLEWSWSYATQIAWEINFMLGICVVRPGQLEKYSQLDHTHQIGYFQDIDPWPGVGGTPPRRSTKLPWSVARVKALWAFTRKSWGSQNDGYPPRSELNNPILFPLPFLN